MTVIRFADAVTGAEVGRVRVTAAGLDADPRVATVAESWKRAGGTPEGFADRYRDWSDGYTSSAIS